MAPQFEPTPLNSLHDTNWVGGGKHNSSQFQTIGPAITTFPQTVGFPIPNIHLGAIQIPRRTIWHFFGPGPPNQGQGGPQRVFFHPRVFPTTFLLGHYSLGSFSKLGVPQAIFFHPPKAKKFHRPPQSQGFPQGPKARAKFFRRIFCTPSSGLHTTQGKGGPFFFAPALVKRAPFVLKFGPPLPVFLTPQGVLTSPFFFPHSGQFWGDLGPLSPRVFFFHPSVGICAKCSLLKTSPQALKHIPRLGYEQGGAPRLHIVLRAVLPAPYSGGAPTSWEDLFRRSSRRRFFSLVRGRTRLGSSTISRCPTLRAERRFSWQMCSAPGGPTLECVCSPHTRGGGGATQSNLPAGRPKGRT